MSLVESDVSIKAIKSAVSSQHTHENKDLLDSLVSDGSSSKYLGADGQYHDAPANFSTDAFIESFNQDGTVKASKDGEGKLKLDTDNTFADGVDGKVVGSIEPTNVSSHQVDLNIKKVGVKTGEVTDASLKHLTTGSGVSVEVDEDEITIGLLPNEEPLSSKMDKVPSASPSNFLIVDENGQAVDGGYKASDFAGKTSFNSHVSNSDIHVTAQDKLNWNAKQAPLTVPQVVAVNSGVSAAKVAEYDELGTSKLSVSGHPVSKNVVTDGSGNIVTEDKPNLSLKIDKVVGALNNRVPAFNTEGGLKDSGLILGAFPSNQTVFEYVSNTIVSSVGGSIYQGTFTYFGTRLQVESIGEPVVDPVTGLSTAIIYDGLLGDFTGLYKGVYEDGSWEWSPVEPAPTGGFWFEVEYSLVSTPVSAARVVVRMDGVNPAALDVRLDSLPALDNISIGLDSLGKISLKTRRLSSGKDVLNSVTADNLAYEFTDEEGTDTSKTIKEKIDEILPEIPSDTTNKFLGFNEEGIPVWAEVKMNPDEVTLDLNEEDKLTVLKVPNKLTVEGVEFDGSEAKSITVLPTQVTKTVYVDKDRTDSYAELGTIYKPFKTIQSAINYVVSLNYDEYVNIEINNGIYDESIILENSALKYVVLTGKGYVCINPLTEGANSLQSVANNNNLFALHLRNIVLSKPVVITGVSGTTGFVDVVLNGVSFNGTASMDISCINNITFKQCHSECDVRLENVNYCDVEASQFQGNLTIVADGTADVPGNGGNFTLVASALTLLGTPTYLPSNGLTITLALTGCRWGLNVPVTVPFGTTIYAYFTFLRGATTNNGNVFLRGGSTFENYVAGTGTLDITGNNSKFQYFDKTDTDLESADVESAIKELNQIIGEINQIQNVDNSSYFEAGGNVNNHIVDVDSQQSLFKQLSTDFELSRTRNYSFGGGTSDLATIKLKTNGSGTSYNDNLEIEVSSTASVGTTENYIFDGNTASTNENKVARMKELQDAVDTIADMLGVL